MKKIIYCFDINLLTKCYQMGFDLLIFAYNGKSYIHLATNLTWFWQVYASSDLA